MRTRPRSRWGVVVVAELAAVEPEEIAGAANSGAGHHALPVAVALPEPHQHHP